VVLRGDPTQDVRALRVVLAVVQRGKLHWRAASELSAATPRGAPRAPAGSWREAGPRRSSA
jgi:hypothetical protein